MNCKILSTVQQRDDSYGGTNMNCLFTVHFVRVMGREGECCLQTACNRECSSVHNKLCTGCTACVVARQTQAASCVYSALRSRSPVGLQAASGAALRLRDTYIQRQARLETIFSVYDGPYRAKMLSNIRLRPIGTKCNAESTPQCPGSSALLPPAQWSRCSCQPACGRPRCRSCLRLQ